MCKFTLGKNISYDPMEPIKKTISNGFSTPSDFSIPSQLKANCLVPKSMSKALSFPTDYVYAISETPTNKADGWTMTEALLPLPASHVHSYEMYVTLTMPVSVMCK